VDFGFVHYPSELVAVVAARFGPCAAPAVVPHAFEEIAIYRRLRGILAHDLLNAEPNHRNENHSADARGKTVQQTRHCEPLLVAA
jgi:hypothetical protein